MLSLALTRLAEMSVPTPHYLLYSTVKEEGTFVIGEGGRHGGNSRRGRWEFVLESLDGKSRVEVADSETDVAGQRLELLAVVRGLEAIDRPARVTLLTSSDYVQRGLRFGLQHWRENNWQWEAFGRMVPVRNADLWRRVDRALGIHQVRCRTWRLDASQRATPPPHHLHRHSRRGHARRLSPSPGQRPSIRGFFRWLLAGPAAWWEQRRGRSLLCAQ